MSELDDRYVCFECGAHSRLERLCFVCGATELVAIDDAEAVEAMLEHIAAPPSDQRWCRAVLARTRGPRPRLGRSRR